MSYMAEAGYRVRLACAPELGGWGKDLTPFSPLALSFPRRLRVRSLAQALAAMPALLRDVRPDILHLHSPAAALPARLLPKIVLPPGMQVVYTVHGFAHQWDSTGNRDRLLGGLERMLARRADMLLFQAQEDYDQAQARGFATRLRLLGNGVEDLWFAIPPPDMGTQLTALFVGRLVREKGVLDLLEALSQVPTLRLLMAGAALDSDRDGVEGEVRRRVAAPDLNGRVELLGMVPRDTLPQVMARASFLVLPSYREGVPRSVIEALAAGRPALVTDIRGCRELVQDGVNGFVVPPRDPVALARGLARLATLSCDAFARMSTAARRSVDPDRREVHVFARLLSAYAELGSAP